MQTGATTPNNLGPAVHRGKDTTHKAVETMCIALAWPQQCWTSCANGSKIVALRFGYHGSNVGNELLIQKYDQFQTLQNNSQQHATTCNRVVKRTQHVTYKNVGSCWPNLVPRALFPGFGKSALGTRLLLANNVVPVCTRLNNLKTKLGGEICASDLNTHKGYCGTHTLDQF